MTVMYGFCVDVSCTVVAVTWLSRRAAVAPVLAAAATALAMTVGGAVAAAPVYAAPPGPVDCRPPRYHSTLTDTPWPVARFAPARIWPLTTGAGVTVAVIDSGVDGDHPQLRGAVLPGRDLLDGQRTGAFDCLGHGTAVASVIAARPVDGVGFTGLAPGVRILPIRVSERILDADGQPQGDSVSLGGLAAAINAAVADGARVVNLSIYYFVDDARVRAAIDNARRHDVVIVAAAGNAHSRDSATRDPVPYPAAYEGVLGVGAVDQNGVRADDSQVGPYVDLVAPGVGVTAAANRSGDHTIVDGTSFATPYVAATAALVRARNPAMTAAEVERWLLRTAGPGRGGPRSDAYGFGEVDPFRAVNESDHPGGRTAVDMPPMFDARAAAERVAAETRAKERSVTLAVAGLAITAAVAFFAAAAPRGRRRRWRPGETSTVTASAGEESGRYEWSLGPRPALAHPDRAATEHLVRLLPGRTGRR